MSEALRAVADRLGGGGAVSRLFGVNDRAGRRWLAEPDRVPLAVQLAAEIVEAAAAGEDYLAIAARLAAGAVWLREVAARSE
jgi:hypothetical protein